MKRSSHLWFLLRDTQEDHAYRAPWMRICIYKTDKAPEWTLLTHEFTDALEHKTSQVETFQGRDTSEVRPIY